MGAFTWMAGRAARNVRSPTAPERAVGLLDEIGDRWNCWRLRSETDRQLRFRIQVQLQTIAIAVEDDLVRLDRLDRSMRCIEEKAND